MVNRISEEQLIDWLKYYLELGEIVNDDFPAKGASSWYPYGYSIINIILKLASNTLIRTTKFEEIVLPSFVHGEDFMKECRNIKDFSERVYWSPLYKENDLHVFTPTIEAQLGSMYEKWVQEGKSLPFKYFTIRGVGRYETGRTIPLWKERNVWPFFEGLTAHWSRKDFLSTIEDQVSFMKSFFAKLGIPILILERPRINKRLQEYSEKRIEAITMTKDRRVVILANIYDLGIIFSKVYGIFYNSKEDNKENYALTSAIGLSGRVLAVLLALNGDEKGFVLSPNIAPIKVAIIPISDKPPVNKMVRKITSELKKIMITSRVFFVTSSLSERRKKIQAMGVPFIIEVGERELKSSQISLKVRSDLNSVQTQIEKLGETVRDQHSVFSKYLESKAKNEFESLNRMANSKKEFLDLAKEEFLIKSLFCDNPGCYTKIIGDSKMEILGSAYGKFSEGKSKCLVCGKAATQTIYYGIKWKGEK